MFILLIIWKSIVIIKLIFNKHKTHKTLQTNNLNTLNIRLNRKQTNGYVALHKIFAVIQYKINLLYPTIKT